MKTRLLSDIRSYFFDGLINFCLCTGLLLGILDAFEIPAITSFLVPSFFLLSITLAIICHKKALHRILFYTLFFLCYFFGVTRLSIYLNSGFYSILNSIIDDYGFYLNTKNYQEYQVYIENERLAVTLFTLFFSGFLLLLLNTAAAEKKNVFVTLLFSLPLLVLPLYIHKEPGILFEALVFCGFFLLFTGKYLRRKKISTSRKKIFATTNLAACILFFTLVFLLLPVHFLFSSDVHDRKVSDNPLKTSQEQSVANFIMFGLSGFFNDYTATGGINGGMLGGINAIRPDYETDLIVEFVPYQDEVLYLKAFTGLFYEGKRWLDYENTGASVPTSLSPLNHREYNALKGEYESGEGAMARIRIKNTGASSYLYTPYYSSYSGVFDNDVSSVERDADGYMDITFYPLLTDTPENDGISDIDNNIYLQVPEDLEPMLEQIREEENLYGNTQTILDNLKTYFETDFTYTMSPGKTPKKEDFVTYFLTESKKGYCTHFASAAVLLLRNAGIPARYVEGYALTPSEMENGTLQNQLSYADYYDGENLVGTSSVLRCEINDSQAHSWVEYYDENFGWRVYDCTPPSLEDEEDTTSLFTRLTRMMSPAIAFTQRNTDNSAARGIQNTFSINPLLYWIFPVLLLLLFLLRLYLRYFSHGRKKNLQMQYLSICKKTEKKHPDFALCQNHTEQAAFLEKHYHIPKESASCFLTLQKLCYAPSFELSTREYHALRKTLFQIFLAVCFRSTSAHKKRRLRNS